MKIQLAAGDGRSSTKVALQEIQPAAGDGCSSIKVVLPENENPAGRRRRPFQHKSCTTRKSDDWCEWSVGYEVATVECGGSGTVWLMSGCSEEVEGNGGGKGCPDEVPVQKY